MASNAVAGFFRVLAPSAVVFGLATTSASALTFDDQFVTGNSCVIAGCVAFSNVGSVTQAEVTAVTNQLAAFYNNNVTVSILFGGSTLDGNGAQSNTTVYSTSYANYTGLLQANSTANPTNTVLNTAVNHFANGNVGPTVAETSDQLRANGAVGTNGAYDNNGNFNTGGTIDAVVLLGTGGADISALVHEIDEVMGGGGAGSHFENGVLGGTDLYRYTGVNTPNQTRAGYLSVDGGTTQIAQFNTNAQGDAGDFTTSPCLIQSWQVCGTPQEALTPSGTYDVGTPEYQMEEALGWNPTASVAGAPGPIVGAGLPGLMFAGVGLLAWRRQRRANSSS
jgi:hypothetical protein